MFIFGLRAETIAAGDELLFYDGVRMVLAWQK
jgi:hypothetical protein